MVGHRYPAHRCHGDCARNAVDRLTLGDCGAIAAAKQADLLLVDGNPGEPAAQVTEAPNHRLVVKAGQIVHDRENGHRDHGQFGQLSPPAARVFNFPARTDLRPLHRRGEQTRT
jgi:hypothetical protein